MTHHADKVVDSLENGEEKREQIHDAKIDLRDELRFQWSHLQRGWIRRKCSGRHQCISLARRGLVIQSWPLYTDWRLRTKDNQSAPTEPAPF